MALISVNTAGLQALVERLRAVYPATLERLSANLEEAGGLVRDAARINAGYSAKVPGSIRVQMAGDTSVRVYTSLPEAVAIENRGAGFVRHPVFGNPTVWTNKNSHPPYLHPAADSTFEAVKVKVVASIHEAFVQAGVAA